MHHGHKQHKKHVKKGDCKKGFCKSAGNDNTKKCPHPKLDECQPPAQKKCGPGCDC